ncbi:hypothetical protein PI124_g13398 [Phytophthora idaei]|nr:hypothetical protein PI125_g14177 [Phytophthora idaei]KAG3146468.1 hypothetical protein PI126_g13305 [Phytophthora idaei]KAG3241733.1 hypothetical protein PI124_g13398 [Phytophthora idaei]
MFNLYVYSSSASMSDHANSHFSFCFSFQKLPLQLPTLANNGGKPASKKKSFTPSPLPADYVSPAKKRQELEQITYRDVGTKPILFVELKDFIKRGMPPTEKVTFYGRFLWKKHFYSNTRPQWRLHFYDSASDLTLDELMDVSNRATYFAITYQ